MRKTAYGKLTVRDAYVARYLAPHLDRYLPPLAAPSSAVSKGLSIRGEGVFSTSLDMSKPSVAMLTDPYDYTFGWVASGATGVRFPPLPGAATYVGNPEELYQNPTTVPPTNNYTPWSTLLPGGQGWRRMRYSRDPFTGTDDSDITNYIGVSTPAPGPGVLAGYSQQQVPVKSSMTPTTGYIEIEAEVSFTGTLYVYAIAANSNPYLLGPQTNTEYTNSGDPSDSVTLWGNPLLRPEDPGSVNGLYSIELQQYAKPIVLVGGGNSASRRICLDLYPGGAGTWVKTYNHTKEDEMTPSTAGAVLGEGELYILPGAVGDPWMVGGKPRFTYGGAARDTHEYSSEMANETVTQRAAAFQSFAAQTSRVFGTSTGAILRGSDAFIVAYLNGDASASAQIVVKYHRSYGITTDPRNVINDVATKVAKVDVALPDTSLGQVGVGATMKAARLSRVQKVNEQMVEFGEHPHPVIMTEAVQHAVHDNSDRLVSGLVHSVADIGGKITHSAQQLGEGVLDSEPAHAVMDVLKTAAKPVMDAVQDIAKPIESVVSDLGPVGDVVGGLLSFL